MSREIEESVQRPNVLLINGWSDDNRGDAAIVLGLVRLIEDQISGQPRFTVVSSFSRATSFYNQADRHTRSSIDQVVPSPLPVVSERQSKLGRKLKQLGRIVQATGLLAVARGPLARVVATRDQRTLLDLLKGADLVVGKGGHMYFSGGGYRGFLTLFQNIYPLLLAERVGAPTAVHAQSIGPVAGVASRALLRKALKLCDAIYTREHPSEIAVNELLGDDRARFAWDTAFAMPAESLPPSVVDRLPDRFVAITVRRWHFPYSNGDPQAQYQSYLRSVADAAIAAFEDVGLSIVIVPQVTGPTDLEDDRIASSELEEMIGQRAPVLRIDDDLSPGQLRSLYAAAELLVGTRFHSVILALAARTPALAISYHGFKTPGIMDRLGLSEYVFDIGDVDSGDLSDAVLDLHANKDAISAAVNTRVDQVVAESKAQVAAMMSDAGVLQSVSSR